MVGYSVPFGYGANEPVAVGNELIYRLTAQPANFERKNFPAAPVICHLIILATFLISSNLKFIRKLCYRSLVFVCITYE